ncbi:MAG TPA: glycosyltransferase family 87 protein [Candidatus Limnocylindrales bacterium]
MTDHPRPTRSRWGILTLRQYRILRFTCLALGILFAIYYWYYETIQMNGSTPCDAIFYWGADPSNLYPKAAEGLGNGYVYTPAFEFLAAPWRILPFLTFVAIYRAILLGIVVRLAGPLTLPVMLAIPVASEITCGNIQIILALAIVLSRRWPAAWAVVLLTKVTPGVGLLYYVFRREWRYVAIAAGATGIVLLLALVIYWGQWPGYIRLMSNPAPVTGAFIPTFWMRLPFALAIVAVGAHRGWWWTTVVAAFVALPAWYPISPSLLIGVLPTFRERAGRFLLKPERRPVNA